MPYEQPAQAEKFSPRDHPEWLGKLFLIYPVSSEMVAFNDDAGNPKPPSKILTADIAIVDHIDPQTGQPTVLLGAKIGGKGLVPQVEPYLLKPGTAAAGRLRQLPAQGQKSGAYVLDNFQPTDAPSLNAFDATAWRGQINQPAAAPAAYTPPVPPATAQPVYQPPLAPLGAGPTATPGAPTASPGAPWYGVGDGPQVLAKLLGGGVANATTLDEQTARMIATSLPG